MLNIGIGEPLQIDYQIFFWVLMMTNLILIAIAKTLNQNYFSALFGTAIINRHLLQSTQEELKLGSASSIMLTITYFINAAIILAYLAEMEYGSLILITLGILIGAVLVKWLSMWILSVICETKRGIVEHGMNHLIYYQVSGLILTPILLISHFFPENIYNNILIACLLLMGFLLIFREIQSIGRAIKARISPLYIILYLCTLEILPFVLIINAFVNKNTGLN